MSPALLHCFVPLLEEGRKYTVVLETASLLLGATLPFLRDGAVLAWWGQLLLEDVKGRGLLPLRNGDGAGCKFSLSA